MAEPFIGEIKLLAFDWAPTKWAKCDGTEMAISQNAALYSLVGTQFGGDGRSTFNLPDLRGRTPVHTHNSGLVTQGMKGGLETVTLTPATVPSHTHPLAGTTAAADTRDPTNALLAETGVRPIYHAATNLVTMNPSAVAPAGSSTVHGHDNMQPYIVINFCISLDGVYPPRN